MVRQREAGERVLPSVFALIAFIRPSFANVPNVAEDRQQ